jgi:hypothetical protein
MYGGGNMRGPAMRTLGNPYRTWTIVATTVKFEPGGLPETYGEVIRRKIDITEDGCSPASEYPQGITRAAMTPSVWYGALEQPAF